jgi:hypothetical protein
MFSLQSPVYWPVLIVIPVFVGCGGAPVDLVPVSGSVRFEDGTIPTGEVADIYFEPMADGDQPLRKAARGSIDPKDGSFQLTTVEPGDGAILGSYKVILEVHKTYLGRESLIPEQYTDPETTPFQVTVGPSGASQTEFVLPKP